MANNRNSPIDILCFSSSDWEGKWGSRQQVMGRFAARGYRVLFIERQVGLEHLTLYPDIRLRKRRRWKEGLRTIATNLWIVSLPPFLPGRYYSLRIARWNQRLAIKWVQPYLNRLGFQNPILWVYRPEDGGLVGHFGERLAVYHCIDEFTADTRGRKRQNIKALELETLHKVNLVFANSLLTYQNKSIYNPQTYRISSGADVEHFSRTLHKETPVHPAVADLPHPIAGYVGNINEKFDISMLTTTATLLPNWLFLIIGQTYPQRVDLSPLQKQTNVHFLGRFPFDDIPSLVKGMDVCLIPYADTEFTRFRSPLKLYEYLASGKPVISTDHPEVREFSDWVEIATTPNEFAAAITRTFENDSLEKQRLRAEMAQGHSWDHRVTDMEQILLSILAKHEPA